MRYGVITRLVQHGVPSRYYYVRTTEGEQRSWRTTGQETLALAKEQVRTWQLREAQGERYTQRVTMREALSQWMAQRLPRVSPSTQIYYRRLVGEWHDAFGSQLVFAVQASDIDAYLEGKQPAAPRSQNRRIVMLRSFFAWAANEGYCLRSPASRIPLWRASEKTITALTPEDETRLLESARLEGENRYGYVLCLLCTGLRRGTVAALEWGHIDWSRAEWRLPANIMKNRRPYTGRPIEDTLLAWLTAHRKASGRVFENVRDETWWRIAKRALLPKVTRHDLRRSFITRCRRRGMDMETTKWFSGHRDVSVLVDCYRQVNADDARKALNASRQ